MNKKLAALLLSCGLSTSLLAANNDNAVGIVNFTSCVTESKQGKHEQEQLESVRKQWASLIEQTEKEFKEISAKFEDRDYLDSLSPEAEQELKNKQQVLGEDLSRYQGQLYQVLNQANYFLVQKLAQSISDASKEIAKKERLKVVLNQEACFYTDPAYDVTTQVLKKMDENFLKEQKTAANTEAKS